MKVLFIGGTGIISTSCVERALTKGLDLTLLTAEDPSDQCRRVLKPSTLTFTIHKN
jgi:hypothetical protein